MAPAKTSFLAGPNTIQGNSVPCIAKVSQLEENYICVLLNTTKSRALVDTGASISCISKSFLHNYFPKESIVYENSQHNLVKGVGGEILTVVGAVQIPIQIQNKTFTAKLHVFNILATLIAIETVAAGQA